MSVVEPERSCRHSITTEPQEPPKALLALNRHPPMESIADAFQARPEALQQQSEIADRKVAATINRCHQLITEVQASDAQWAADHPNPLRAVLRFVQKNRGEATEANPAGKNRP
jgi:hypothetical protein